MAQRLKIRWQGDGFGWLSIIGVEPSTGVCEDGTNNCVKPSKPIKGDPGALIPIADDNPPEMTKPLPPDNTGFSDPVLEFDYTNADCKSLQDALYYIENSKRPFVSQAITDYYSNKRKLLIFYSKKCTNSGAGGGGATTNVGSAGAIVNVNPSADPGVPGGAAGGGGDGSDPATAPAAAKKIPWWWWALAAAALGTALYMGRNTTTKLPG